MLRMKKIVNSAKFQLKLHKYLKYVWLAIAIFSVTPWGTFIQQSLAAVVFFSIYANYVAHWSTERAIEAELSANGNNK